MEELKPKAKVTIKANLTAQRAPKSDKPEVIVSPTLGQIRLNAITSELLNLKPAQYIGIVSLEVDDTNKAPFGLIVSETEADGFSKLANSNGKVGSPLQFSAANAWTRMGGTNDNVKVYVMGEGLDAGEGQIVYPLEFLCDRAKIERGSSEEGDDENTNNNGGAAE